MKANLFFAAAMTLVMLSGCTGNKENTIQTSEAVTFDEVLANVNERDRIDSTRKESPLRQAADAVVLDNSNMTMAEQDEWLYQLYLERVRN